MKLFATFAAVLSLALSDAAWALDDCCADLEERVAELEATVGSPDSLTVLRNSTIVVAADDFNNNAVQVTQLFDGTQLETSTIPSQGSNSVILGIVEDSGAPGDGSTLSIGNIDPAAQMRSYHRGLETVPANQIDTIQSAWEDIADQFSTRGCMISVLKTRPGASYGIRGPNPGGSPSTGLISSNPPGFPGIDFLTVTYIPIAVHCTNGETYHAVLLVSSPDLETPDQIKTRVIGISQLTATGSSQAKGVSVPPVVLPPAQMTLTLGSQAATAFFGAGPGGGGALPTVVWSDAELNPLEVLQIDGPNAGFGSDMELCGQINHEHLWLAWTDDTGNGQLAYIADRQATVTDLGPIGGQVALACDVWGNAVVAFSNLPGSEMTLAAFDSAGLAAGATSFDSNGGFTGMTIALDMNNNGDIGVAWRTLNATTIVARVTLPDVISTDMSFAGSWNSPFFDGEGFIWDIAEIDGIRSLVLYYFTYQPDGSGRQAWVVGSAPLVNGVATVPVAITEGAQFGDAFDSDDVEVTVWGEIEARVLGCRSALMTMRSPLFGDHSYLIEKFTTPSPGLPGLCVEGDAAAQAQAPVSKAVTQVDGSFTGSYFNPARNFEGFIIDITEIGGQTTIVVYWFTYDNDGSGQQLWLVGAAPINGDSVTLPLVRTSGGQFGPEFDPTAIAATSFVTVTIEWSDCDNATVGYETEDGETGQFAIQRLAPLPGNAGGSCGN